jgi:uncharacterized protein (TIGR02594 family)
MVKPHQLDKEGAMSSVNEMILAAAGEHLGLKEWPGSKHNPQVVKMFEDSGHAWVKDDETPWCAAFVGSVLASVGIQGTGQLNARSYLNWGEPVRDPRPGDVVIFWRGTKGGWQGHVGFFVRWHGEDIVVRGGNQGNAVSDAVYSGSRLLGFRRAKSQRSSLISSTTLQAAGVSGTAVVGGASTILSALGPEERMILVAAAVVALAGLAWIARERIKKWAAGVR